MKRPDPRAFPPVPHQQDIFGSSVPLTDVPRVRSSDPGTSAAAAASVNLAKRCAEVLEVAQTIGGSFTDGELRGMVEEAWSVDVDRGVVARRRLDLVQAGMIEPVVGSNGQCTRMGGNGRPQLLWRLTEEGRSWR